MSLHNLFPLMLSPILLTMIQYDQIFVNGKMTYDTLPSDLDDCLQRLYNQNDVVMDTAESIATTCLSDYIWKNVAVRCYDLPQKSLEYIGRMVSPYFDENSRQKRETPRVRKEYRSLTIDERGKFHKALNELKSDTSVFPNAYDVIAQFHNFEVAGAAHGGAAFLPWHRVYLLIMENALRTKQPDVTIPYWDFVLDGNLEDPDDSIMWTKDFMGSTDNDRVQDGPIKDWGIRRAIGRSELADERRLSELLEVKSSTEFAQRLERYHNRAHGWVGGNMWSLERAPFDPMFFMLHCFIDHIWWQWQTNNRDESFTWEYPLNDEGPHGEEEVVMGLSINGKNVTNGEAYNKTWAFEYIQYEPRPKCVCEKPNCFGPNMQCEFQLNTPVCVSATVSQNCRRRRDMTNIDNQGLIGKDIVQEKRDISKRSIQTKRSLSSRKLPIRKSSRNITLSSSSNSHKVDIKILEPAQPLMKKPRIPKVKDYIHAYKGNMTRTGSQMRSDMDHVFSIQNKFEINCEEDSNLWVFMPFKVVHLRPHGKIYNSHLVTKGNVTDELDMYSEQMYRSLRAFIKPENPISFEKCKLDNSGITKVKVSSYGLSYNGMYKDYVILDNKQAIDGKVGYIAFKRPDDNPSKFMLTAFDECGRVCAPKCLVHNTNPPQYKPCSGVLNIDSKKPKRYGDTYGEAVLRYWNFENRACPKTKENDIDIVFYCEYKSEWYPWV